MAEYKKFIFVRAITARVEVEQREKEDIIKEYVKLIEEEKREILF
ncbi:hypothetical protein [Clostridium sp. UBA6640]|nr:hypothetical protein [Clostridium sp. UBA6640]